jgi:phosphoglycolate phosphatase
MSKKYWRSIYWFEMENNKLKAIFFDFDGVLMNSHDLTIEIIQEFYPDYTKEEFDTVFHTNLYEDEKVMNVVINHKEKFDKLFIEKTKPEHFFEFAEKLLEDLSKKYKLYIISGAPTHCLVNHLDLINSTFRFTKILGSDVSRSKVERFNMLFESENLNASDCIFITDSLGDIIEANQVSLKSVGVTFGVHSRETLQMGNPYIIVDEICEFEKLLEEF